MKNRILVILAAALVSAACTTVASRQRQGSTANGSNIRVQEGADGSQVQGTSLNGVYQGVSSNGNSVELEAAHVVGGQLFVGGAAR